ncbi:MAG: SRPBCC family protein, partial [Parvibaculaceae bacterium]
MDRRDDPAFAEHADATDPRFTGGLRAGARTWSMNGQLAGPEFPDLTPEECAAGQTFVTTLPAMFLIAHPDYVRTVRLLPLGPTRTELLAEWLFPEETLAAPGFDLANTVDFATLVMSQDGKACELNQRGLAALPHERGILMPQEYEISGFHRWIREMLDDHKKGGENA